MNGTANEGLLRACGSADELWNWLDRHMGLRVPRVAVCPEHQAPFEYLKAAYLEPARDLVVWAPRGGGKTFLAAVATMLDLLHKPGCQVRILGGSLDQSLRMWEHLHPMLLEFAGDRIAGKAMARRLELVNGASAGVLAQSQRAIRGLRIQKLRCDEVEMFDPRVWHAAQLTTRSAAGRSGSGWRRPGAVSADQPIKGVIEAISTLHECSGLMQQIVESAYDAGRPVIRWCLLEVLEACPPQRPCATCPLAEECKGIAKTACSGFVSIDDAIAMKQRVSQEMWDTEILCKRPSNRLSVFPTFDPAIHVRETIDIPAVSRLTASIDFGFVNGFALLWIRRYDDGTVHVIDERVVTHIQLDEHLEYLKRKPWGEFHAITCDPAGKQRNGQTGTSEVALLRKAGYTVLCRSSHITDGLEMIRAALRPAAGPVRLFIHPRCTALLTAMRRYSYKPHGGENPHKDGKHDHPADALRYHYVNHVHSGIVKVRSY